MAPNSPMPFPINTLDGLILDQFSKVSKKFKLDQGKKKYYVSSGLWLAQLIFCGASGAKLFGDYEKYIRFAVYFPDFAYNTLGLIDNKKENVSNKNVEFIQYQARKFNSYARTPAMVFGGLMFLEGVAEMFLGMSDGDTYLRIDYGFGLMSLSGSMFAKEANPQKSKKYQQHTAF